MPDSHDTEVVTRYRLETSGNMAKDLRDTAKAAAQVTAELNKAGQAAKDAGKSIQQMASERIRGIVQEREVMKQVEGRMRAAGMDVMGNRLPQRAPPPTSLQRFGQGIGGVAQAAPGQFGLSGLLGSPASGAAAGVALGVAMIAVFKAGMDRVAHALEIQASRQISSTRKTEGQFEALDPFGIVGGWRRLMDAKHVAPIRNLNERLYGEMDVALATRAEMAPEAASRMLGAQEATYRAAAIRQNRYGRMPFIDESTAAGQIAYGIAEQRLSARDQLTRAQRGLETAQDTAGFQAGEVRTAERNLAGFRSTAAAAKARYNQLQSAEERLNAMTPGPAQSKELAKSKALLDTALRDQLQAEQNVLRGTDRLREQQNRHEEKSLELSRSKNELQQALLGMKRTELAIVQQEEQRASAASMRLGSMHAGARMQGLAAMKFVDRYGVGAATPEILNYARQYAPLEMGKRFEQFGETTPEYAAGREAGYADFTNKPLKELREEKNRLVNEVRGKMQESDEQLASDIANTLVTNHARFMKLVQDYVDRRMEEFRAQELLRRN